MQCDQVTLFVPTMNRSNFLIRMLNYYHSIDFQGAILIGDSSSEEHASEIQKTVDQLASRLKVQYHAFPGVDEFQVNQKLTQAIQTPYAAWQADDDLFIPSGLEKSMQFLEDNPAYNAAWGLFVKIKVKHDKPYGPIISLKKRMPSKLEAQTASQRLIDFAVNHYQHYMSVFRTPQIQKVFRNAHLVPHPRAFGCSDLFAFGACMYGRRPVLNHLISVHQQGEYQTKKKTVRNTKHRLDWLLTNEWFENYQMLLKLLPSELATLDHIPQEEAVNIFKNVIQIRLVREFGGHQIMKHLELSKFGLPPAENQEQMNRSLLPIMLQSRFPILRKAATNLKSLFVENLDLSLKGLLNPSSPFHGDFMQIHQTITNQEVQK